MAAVGAAVLGAPISTALIVFEMTGDWQTGIAVMTSVSLSSALASTLVRRSFFLTQLERRGIHLSEGPQAWLPHQLRVTPVIRALDAPDAPAEDLVRAMAERGPTVAPTTTLAEADVEAQMIAFMKEPLFERSEAVFLAVTACDGPDDPLRLIGSVHHVDVLRALNQALEQTAAEEHG